jgi:hypothetical protein
MATPVPPSSASPAWTWGQSTASAPRWRRRCCPPSAVAPATPAPLRWRPAWPPSTRRPRGATPRLRSRPEAASSQTTSRARPPCSPRLPSPAHWGGHRLAPKVFSARRPPPGLPRRTVARHRPAMPGPRPQERAPGAPGTPEHPRQALRPGSEPTLPRAAAGQAAMFPEQGSHLLREGVLLVQKGQPGSGKIEAVDNHNDARFNESLYPMSCHLIFPI